MNWHIAVIEPTTKIVNLHVFGLWDVLRECGGLLWGFPGQPAPVPMETPTPDEGRGF